MLPSLSLRRAATRAFLFTALAGSVLIAVPALASAAGTLNLNAVYTQNNNTKANSILVFRRHNNGSLTLTQSVLTGGKGAVNQPPFGFRVVDSSESIRLSNNGRLLFAVNSGDDSVSSFAVTTTGLHLISHRASGGHFPVSLAISGHLLYVLNEKSGTISGLRFANNGTLSRIAHSTRSLFTHGSAAAAAQIGFSPNGKVLNVTERLENIIDTFRMHANGTPGAAVATATPTGANNPFGFTYRGNLLIVTNADAADSPHFSHSSVSSYRITSSAAHPLSVVTPKLLTGGGASCWISLSRNKQFGFISNTGSGGTPNDISRIKIASNGALSLIGHAPGTAGFTADSGLSSNGRYLYVIQPSNVSGFNPATFTFTGPAPATSHIDEYKVGTGGALTLLGSTPSKLPNGLSGIAAW